MSERLRTISRHLTVPTGLDEYRQRGVKFSPQVLRQALDGATASHFHSVLEKTSKVPILTNIPYIDMPRAKLREFFVKQIVEFLRVVPLSYEDDISDLRKSVLSMMSLWAVNQGLCIRLAVHLTLYGDSIRCLGTEKHLPYLKRAFALQDYGSFGMTELGHGSNAGAVETTATYDPAKREFDIHTPTPMAAKWWVGAMGKTANMSVIFARLILKGVDQGVHVFLVQIRDLETHEPMPGVVLGDCGPKQGLQGIDNGFAIFHHYRVPYDSLLDKFSHISVDGKLKSTIKNKEKRFAVMLSAFTRGRYGIITGSLLTLRNALTIAIRFAAVRTQFNRPNAPEVSILDYPLLRYRLMPHLANLFAAAQGCELIRNRVDSCKQVMSEAPDGPEANELHALLAFMKPLASWYSQKAVQEARETLAGHGYSAFSGLGTYLVDNDVNSTWEGDNNVLLQQTSRFLFKAIQKLMKGQRLESEFTTFLTLDLGHVLIEKAKFDTKTHLRDNIPLLKAMMEHRTSMLIARSVKRLQENGMKFGEMFDVWNQTQVFYMHPLAIAFGEKVMCDELAKVIESTKSQCTVTSALLTRLLELFVLSKAVSDSQSFRDADYVSSDQMHIIRDYTMDLCNELADNSVKIIDAIAIPDSLLGSPFAVSDGQMYSAYTRLVEQAQGCYEKPEWVPLLKEARKTFANRLG